MSGDDVLIKLKPLAVNIAVPLAAGGLAALLTRGSFAGYGELARPSFAPPGWVFPVVWTALYLLMGISSYMVWASESPQRAPALKIYAAQLAVNFFWPILFFVFRGFLVSFLWLMLLIMLTASMISDFSKIRPAAGLLQLPYFLWCCFAAALNWSIYLLNR